MEEVKIEPKRTLEEINQEYTRHAMDVGDSAFKIKILHSDIKAFQDKITIGKEKMMACREEANQINLAKLKLAREAIDSKDLKVTDKVVSDMFEGMKTS